MASKDIAIRLSLQDGETVRRSLMALGDDGQKALAKIEKQSAPASKGLLAVNAVTGELRAGMQGAGSGLGAVGTGLGAMGTAGLAAAAGIGAVVAGFSAALAAARVAVEEMDALGDVSERLGIAVEPLQELRYAFSQNGVEANTFDMAMQRLTRRMGEIALTGKGEAKAALEELGIAVTDSTGRVRTMEEVLPEIADAMAGVTDQSRRLSLAQKLFDSEGVALVSLLQQGSAELERFRREARELGIVMDERLVASAGETADRLATMQQVIDTQLNSALVSLSPILVGIAETLAEGARWIGAWVDGFRELENMTTAGLRRELAELQAYFERVGDGSNIRSQTVYNQKRSEMQQIEAELARREAEASAPRFTLPGVTVSAADPEADKRAAQIAKVTEALQFQVDQLSRGAFEQRVFQELQRAGIEWTDAEAKGIADLVWHLHQADLAKKRAAESERVAQKAQQDGEAMTARLLDAAARRSLAEQEINDLLAAGAISAQTAARAHEELERSRLGASRDAADGIKRALLDIRDASTDLASQWEEDITGMNQTARSAFVDITSGAKTMAEGLSGILDDLQRRIMGRIYDQTVGVLFDGILDGVFGANHAGGMVGEGGMTRRVSPLAFAGAPRLHSGGMVPGLRPGETPIVALQGERVLTEAQQDNTARTIAGLAALARPATPGVNVVVNNNAGQAQARAQVSQGRDGGLNIDIIVEEIENRMTRNVGRGEGMAPTLERRYGLDPAVGARR